MKSKITIRKSPIHGKGVFAKRRLRRGMRVGRYEGQETETDGIYVLWIDQGNGTYAGRDGKNDLRFLNHSSDPNAEFDNDELYVIRTIQPGEEITFHYGEDWKTVP